jgi:hypothetical protein
MKIFIFLMCIFSLSSLNAKADEDPSHIIAHTIAYSRTLWVAVRNEPASSPGRKTAEIFDHSIRGYIATRDEASDKLSRRLRRYARQAMHKDLETSKDHDPEAFYQKIYHLGLEKLTHEDPKTIATLAGYFTQLRKDLLLLEPEIKKIAKLSDLPF